MPRALPPYLQLRPVLMVLVGGVLGTPARYAVTLALPVRAGTWPTPTFLVNLVGAFLLGALLEALTRAGPSGRRDLLRLLLGTGFLGSFTTYSSLAVDSDLLVRAQRPGLAVAYALTSVGAGLLLAALGVACGARWRMCWGRT